MKRVLALAVAVMGCGTAAQTASVPAATVVPSTPASITAAPSPSASVATPVVTATPMVTARPVTLDRAHPANTLAPGTYRVPNAVGVDFTITVPDLWTAVGLGNGHAGFHYQHNSSVAIDGRPWVILDRVSSAYADPCHTEAGPAALPSPATVEAVVALFTSFVGFDAGPVTDVVISGHAGKRFDLTNDIDTDTAGCTNGADLYMWTTGDGTEIGGTNSGSRLELWLIDVGGSPLLIVGESYPTTPEAARLQMEQIIASIAFP